MFKFLKEKIKGALSKITKSVEEESAKEEVKEQFEEKNEIKEESKVKDIKKDTKTKSKKNSEKKHKEKATKEHKNEKKKIHEVIEEKQELKEEIVIEEPKEELNETEFETKAESIQETAKEHEEKKGFFTKLKEKFISKEPEEIKEEFREVKLEKEEEIIEEIKPQEEVKSEEKKGFFGIIKEKITTTKISEEKFEDLFYDLEVALLENNVAFEVVDKIKTDLKNDLVDKPIKRGDVENQVVNSLKESIEDLFLTPKINLIEKIKEKNEKPYVICFVGQNGSGKTTSISKLGNLLKEKGISVVFAAADTFRAAAIQQIKEWGEKLSIKVIAHDYGSDPAAVAFDAISYAKSHKIDVVLIDTAGRQHSNLNLMKELEKIVRVSKPDLKIFVGESLVGSDAVLQAQDYNKSIGIDGIILTKADVDEKGGAIISVSYVTHRPIMYLGIGQSLNDLQEFDSEKVVEGLGL